MFPIGDDMPIIICKVCQEREGQKGQFAAQVCPHLFKRLNEDKTINDDQFKVIKVEITLFATSVVHHWFCNQCVKNHHLPTEDNRVLSEKEVDSTYKEAFNELRLYCYNCLEEKITSVAR